MSKAGAMLSARILAELKELSALVERIEQGWERSKLKNDDYYLDGVALNLHGFYSGLERIFEKIASTIDGTVPSAANWHQELLNQISIEIPGVRPVVISSELKDLLEDYRGFRHVVRNVYTYQLNPEKMEHLVIKIRQVFEKSNAELSGFARFLQSI